MGILSSLHEKTVFLDTAPLIYYMEDSGKYPELIPFFDQVHNGRIHLVTTHITLLEVLVMPFRQKQSALAAQYERILAASPSITVAPLSLNISRTAAKLRAEFGLKTPDAIQIATAQEWKASFFLTNDYRLKVIPEINLITPTDL